MNRQDAKRGAAVIWIGAAGNALLIALKVFLGIIGRSQALLADAAHSLSDFVSDAMALAGLRFASKERDENHPFGHGKIESLMALLIGVMVLLAGLWIGVSAVTSLFQPAPSPTAAALLGALVSIAVKESMFQYTIRVGRAIGSQILAANAWHHRSDALSSVAAAAGIGGALLNPDWAKLDAWAAIVVAVLILKAGADIIIPAFRAAADTAPPAKKLDMIRQAALDTDGVLDAHDVRARQYAEQLYVEIHVVVKPSLTVERGHQIADMARENILQSIPRILDVIVHVDPAKDKGD